MGSVLCLMGPAASGKSFISTLFQRRAKFDSISIGQLCRDAYNLSVSEGTKARAFEAVTSGALISEVDIDEMLRAHLARGTSDRICLDGFPRVAGSVALLGTLVGDFALGSVVGVHVNMPRSLCEERFLARRRPEQLAVGFEHYWLRYVEQELKAIRRFREEYELIEVIRPDDIEGIIDLILGP